ncbi:MAG: DUF4440 domain-containing protein, partial [Microvirgula sp.]
MKFRLFYVALSLGLISGPVLARSVACHKTGEREVAALFDRWNDSLKTGDPARVVANYATNSILLPTLSNQPRL